MFYACIVANEVLPFFPDFPVSMQHGECIARISIFFTPFPSASSRAFVRAMISALWAELPGGRASTILLRVTTAYPVHCLPTLAHEAVSIGKRFHIWLSQGLAS